MILGAAALHAQQPTAQRHQHINENGLCPAGDFQPVRIFTWREDEFIALNSRIALQLEAPKIAEYVRPFAHVLSFVSQTRRNIKVGVRLRPAPKCAKPVLMMGSADDPDASNTITLVVCARICERGRNLTIDPQENNTLQPREYSFDHVFSPEVSQVSSFGSRQQRRDKWLQSELYEQLALPLVTRAVHDGVNACIMAYGQTGSGKTYTMLGDGSAAGPATGIIPRVLDTILDSFEERKADNWSYSCTASYLEIYKGMVKDLLDPYARVCCGRAAVCCGRAVVQSDNLDAAHVLMALCSMLYHSSCAQRRIREQGDKFVADGAIELPVTSSTDAKEMLRVGTEARTVGSTSLNERSSRSHAILLLKIKGTRSMSTGDGRSAGAERIERRTAWLYLVDLAGSEDPKRSGARLTQMKEAGKIHQSLSSLCTW